MSKALNIRLPEGMRETFDESCSTIGINPSELIREMINAFNDGRLQIKKSEILKQKLETLYVD